MIVAEFTHAGEAYHLLETETCGAKRTIIRRVSDNMWRGAADTVEEAKAKLERQDQIKGICAKIKSRNEQREMMLPI